jgi:hypothetical protein
MHPVRYVVILTTEDFSRLSPLTVATMADDGGIALGGGVVTSTPETIAVSDLSTNVTDLTSKAPSILVDIWDDRYVERKGKKGETMERWLCKWCKKEFKKWNATKCLAHVCRQKGHDIKVCNGAITEEFGKLYKTLLTSKNDRKVKRMRSSNSIMEHVTTLQDSNADALEARNKKKCKFERQGTVPGLYEASVATKLDMAIADFVHGHALSFRLSESARFKRVLELARFAGMYLPDFTDVYYRILLMFTIYY